MPPASDKTLDTVALMKTFKKAYGTTVGGLGVMPEDIVRAPTGVFEFDLGTGGGFPRRRLSIVYGPESSGKSILLLKAIAYEQRTRPELQAVYFDVENTFDAKWAAALGVDVDRLMLLKPDYAEQAVDMIEALLRAPDCGIVGLDSVAALVTTRELNQSAEKDNVGGGALAVGKLVRKSILAMQDAEKAGSMGTLILINQTRMKVGVMYGNPETFSGGNAQKFASCLTARLYGKNIVDNAVSKVRPVRKSHTAVLHKWKVPVLSTHMEWETVTIPHDGRPVGYTGGWKVAEKLLRSAGLMLKTADGWWFDDETLPTLHAWEERFDGSDDLREKIIRVLMAADGLVVGDDGEIPDEELA